MFSLRESYGAVRPLPRFTNQTRVHSEQLVIDLVPYEVCPELQAIIEDDGDR